MATKILGIDGLTPSELNFELQRGGKFVLFQYCLSFLIVSLRRSSNVYFVRADESTLSKSLPFTLLSLVGGWWGIPWGPIWSVMTIVTNLRGGKDVTKEVVAAMNARAAAAPPAPRPAAAPAPPVKPVPGAAAASCR